MCVTSVHAEAPVVCAAFDDAELLSRVRGQTRDLPISLFSLPKAYQSHPTASQLQAVARAQQAAFVVSVDQEPNGARTVYIFDARAVELRVRTAPAPDRKHRFARSAAAETVALIVRGELSDALAVHEAQAARDTQASEERAPAATAAPPERAAPSNEPKARATDVAARPAARPAASKPTDKSVTRSDARSEEPALERDDEPASGTTSRFSLGPAALSVELAARASTPIQARYFLGASLNLRLSFTYFSVGVTGSSTLSNRAELQGLSLSLREHGLAVDALAHLPLTAALRLGLGAAGRWLFYRRSAESGNPEWNPEPADTSITFAVGPQAELRWQLLQHLGVSIRIGLDVLLRPVSWRYRLDTNPRIPIELERQNRTEPWLSVGVYGSM